LNKHDLTLLDQFYAPDYVNHTLQLEGLESLRQFETMIRNGFPDWHETIEDMIAEGDKVWLLYKAAGTHTGEWSFSGITLAPTGKPITFSSVSIYRIVDGKILEGWHVYDELAFFQQLGLIEYTEKAKKIPSAT
jgi:C-1 hydroxylase